MDIRYIIYDNGGVDIDFIIPKFPYCLITYVINYLKDNNFHVLNY